MADSSQQGVIRGTNRVSRFPRTENSDTPRNKRPLDELNTVVRDTKQSVQRLRKRQATPDVSKPFSKEVASPWQDYQKSFKLNQAGYGLVVHAKNATFAEGVLKEIRGYGKEKLSKITSYSHKNLVKLQKAFYDDGTVFLLYEMMDVTLAQIFSSPLGRLQLYEVAAFSQEILTGIDYIHNGLEITHGDLTSDSILMSVSGAIKIGMSPSKSYISPRIHLMTRSQSRNLHIVAEEWS
jgi:serine/threonine protein kinase